MWVNTASAALEASGTSGLKVVLNGGLTSGPRRLVVRGLRRHQRLRHRRGAVHPDVEIQDARDAESLYRSLEEEVVPLFYDRDPTGVPPGG